MESALARYLDEAKATYVTSRKGGAFSIALSDKGLKKRALSFAEARPAIDGVVAEFRIGALANFDFRRILALCEASGVGGRPPMLRVGEVLEVGKAP